MSRRASLLGRIDRIVESETYARSQVEHAKKLRTNVVNKRGKQLLGTEATLEYYGHQLKSEDRSKKKAAHLAAKAKHLKKERGSYAAGGRGAVVMSPLADMLEKKRAMLDGGGARAGAVRVAGAGPPLSAGGKRGREAAVEERRLSRGGVDQSMAEARRLDEKQITVAAKRKSAANLVESLSPHLMKRNNIALLANGEKVRDATVLMRRAAPHLAEQVMDDAGSRRPSFLRERKKPRPERERERVRKTKTLQKRRVRL